MALDVRWSVAAKDDSIDARLVDRVLCEDPRDAWARAHHRAGAPVVGCDAVTCQRIVDVLFERHVLRWSRDRRLIRAE